MRLMRAAGHHVDAWCSYVMPQQPETLLACCWAAGMSRSVALVLFRQARWQSFCWRCRWARLALMHHHRLPPEAWRPVIEVCVLTD